MKILCVCLGGNVRSVALATELKQRYRLDALAVGLQKNSPETVKMLLQWADRVVVMQAELANLLPNVTLDICEVGPDIYGSSTHKELQKLVKVWAKPFVESCR